MTERAKEVDLYLDKLEPPRRTALTQVRSLILKTVPDADETMKYKMPTYSYRGSPLAAIASQKRYMSLYMEPRVVDRHRDELEHVDLGKGYIRFKKIEQLPLDLVREMLRETVQLLEEEASNKK